MKRFNVAISREDGGVELHPMKAWLRSHPDRVPEGMHHTNSTSHELRRGLRRLGWSVEETEADVKLIPPELIENLAAIDAVIGSGIDDDAPNEEFASFELEYQLRDFIAQNLSTIYVGGKRLSLYVDSEGRKGVEYPTEVGFIDILTVDSEGNFVVFELKRARSPDHAIGQLARYMGWIANKVAAGKTVYGVIIAKEISTNLRYATTVFPNVSLFKYEVRFELRPASLEDSK